MGDGEAMKLWGAPPTHKGGLGWAISDSFFTSPAVVKHSAFCTPSHKKKRTVLLAVLPDAFANTPAPSCTPECLGLCLFEFAKRRQSKTHQWREALFLLLPLLLFKWPRFKANSHWRRLLEFLGAMAELKKQMCST